MKYMGSKNRIAKHILPIMLAEAEKCGITKWVEPFVGGANMIDKVPSRFERYGYDINNYVVALLSALQEGWQPPAHVTKKVYECVKDNKQHDEPLTGWCGICCSYSGKWFGGYAGKVSTKTGIERDYQQEAIKNIAKQVKLIKGVEFRTSSYDKLSVLNSLIYCDPPYKGTTDYKTGGFDYEKFYEWCRYMKTKGNLVFISEYDAPSDFECVWQGQVSSSLSANGKQGGNKTSVEKLFKV